MAARKALMSAVKCQNCGQRWVQSRGLCRRCQRALGVDTRTNFERERDRVQAQQLPVLLSETIDPPRERVIVVDGRAVTVVWDGTYRTGPG